MKKQGKLCLYYGISLVFMFMLWTALVLTVDVKPAGVNGTNVGFSGLNVWFHNKTGVNYFLYNVTDWLGLVPVLICLAFAFLGFIQIIKRKSLVKVDADIIFLGIYYFVVIALYLAFEMIPINYRPVLINGHMEASYPSSTTLLVLSVMPTLVFQVRNRLFNKYLKLFIVIISALFSFFMVLGRLVSGVHWFTDIVGSCLLSFGLFYIYKAVVILWNLMKNFSN